MAKQVSNCFAKTPQSVTFGRLGEELQFVEVFVDFPLVVILLDDADKDRFLFFLVLHIQSKKGRSRTDGLSIRQSLLIAAGRSQGTGR